MSTSRYSYKWGDYSPTLRVSYMIRVLRTRIRSRKIAPDDLFTYHAQVNNELLSNLVYGEFESSGDLIMWSDFDTIFKLNVADDFGQVIEAT